ncbi:hypothetical protein K438DRAFT_1844693 [Mycena galopus ATCC 62051]|nr:hypothetical protein K438DRAFT_1844693 [Mycena galopus ATCC 62051]
MLADLEVDRALVAQIQAGIFDLERSPADVAELRAEQAMTQERLDSYKYPVLTLPNEITSEILLHFLPPYPSCPPLVGMFSPTHLTHICSRWRAVALATPALWRAIRSPDLGIRLEDIDASEICNAWVGRSGSCPLSIEIDRNSSILPALIPYRTRWESSKFLFSKDSLLLIKGPMPQLRHLQLFCFIRRRFKFPESPQLRSVVIGNRAAIHVTLPWAQLTSLTLSVVGLSTCLRILQQTTRLVHCFLRLSEMHDSRSAGINITLPSLKSLALASYARGPGAAGFLAAIVVPALHRLEFQERFFTPNPVDSLASFIATSDCKLLQEIHITGMSRIVSDDDYRAAFPSIPTFSSG